MYSCLRRSKRHAGPTRRIWKMRPLSLRTTGPSATTRSVPRRAMQASSNALSASLATKLRQLRPESRGFLMMRLYGISGLSRRVRVCRSSKPTATLRPGVRSSATACAWARASSLRGSPPSVPNNRSYSTRSRSRNQPGGASRTQRSGISEIDIMCYQ